MRITHLSLENFRGFASLEIDFDERLTVLVGENGSGKSTVLDAIAGLMRCMVDGDAPELVQSLRNDAERGSAAVTLVPPPTSEVDERGIRETRIFLLPGAIQHQGFRGSLLVAANGTVPVLQHFPATRAVRDRTPGSTTPADWSPRNAWDGALDSHADFAAFFAWFREREDLENEAHVQDGAGPDPRLHAVRTAIERAMPGFSNPHVRRQHAAFRKPTLTLRKDGDLFAFDQLSEGERSLLAMIADIARRLAIANTEGDPLEGRGVVLIDEIELHLHPRWQADVLDRLLGVFPNLQFIVTTHSPLVLTDVKAEQIRVLDGFEVYQPAHPVQGRDAGSILAEVFQTNPLPTETQDAVAQISLLIDADRFDEARAKLAELERKLGGLDVEVTRLRTAIDLLAS